MEFIVIGSKVWAWWNCGFQTHAQTRYGRKRWRSKQRTCFTSRGKLKEKLSVVDLLSSLDYSGAPIKLFDLI